MKPTKPTFKTYAFWILFTEAIGALSGFLTREGTEIYKQTIQKPPLSPPAIVFPIVWTLLFAAMGFAAARIYQSPITKNRSYAVGIYLLQLFFNFFWSIIFFEFEAFGFAFFWLLTLWGLIGLMIWLFAKLDKKAAVLQIPYFLWVTFAAYLNAGVWWLN